MKSGIGRISGFMVYRLNIKAAEKKAKHQKRDDQHHTLVSPLCDSHHAQFLGSVALLTYSSNTALSLSLPTTSHVYFSGEMLMLISSLEGRKHHTTNSWPNAEFFAGRATA